jgi:biopolymer transport protein ExbD|tara:strand:+ start:79 stop:483 length:405 start_codon:yes stop_codon:yes gene_type:complete
LRRRRSVLGSEESMDINISPLIDMVFILLIFFIVTTVFVEETGVEVEKPEAASALQLDRNSVLIAVTSKGQVVYGGKEIGVNGVRAIVRRLTNKEEIPVIVQVDEGANAGLVVRVIDESKLGGAKNISLSADLP